MSASIPTTSISIFRSNTAQPGWTKLTTLNDYMLRVVNGTANINNAQSFTSVFTPMPISGNIIVSGSVANTTITVSQMANHFHPNGNTALLGPFSNPVSSSAPTFTMIDARPGTPVGTRFSPGGSVGNTGGGEAHTHPFSNVNVPMSSGQISLTVKYVDVIIAQRN